MTHKKNNVFIFVKKTICPFFTSAYCNKTRAYSLPLLFLICFLASHLHANSTINKNDLKAAYLYKIIKFIEWPDNAFSTPSSTFNLCVVGENPFEEYFYGLANQKVQGHTLYIEYQENDENITECHMLYIAIAEKNSVITLIKKIQKLPILTVSDSPSFAKNQGMIGFIANKNRIGFEINLSAVLSSNISIRAELLEVAYKVITSQEEL